MLWVMPYNHYHQGKTACQDLLDPLSSDMTPTLLLSHLNRATEGCTANETMTHSMQMPQSATPCWICTCITLAAHLVWKHIRSETLTYASHTHLQNTPLVNKVFSHTTMKSGKTFTALGDFMEP